MKKLITFIILFLSVQIFAQNTRDANNYSVTALDSAGVYTGTITLIRDYNSMSISVRSNQSGTFKVYFGETSTFTTATATRVEPFSYTANDTQFTKVLNVNSPYYKVIYTNGSTAQTLFRLVVMLNKGTTNPLTSAGKVDVNVASSALPTGAATSAKQDTMIARWNTWLASDWATKTLQQEIRDSLNSKFTQWFGKDWATGAKQDSLKAKITSTNLALAQLNDTTKASKQNLDAIKTAIQLIDNAVDGNYLNVNTNFAGTDASVNTGNADATTQRVVLATDQPTIPVTISSTDTVTVKSIVDALPVGTNIIGKVGIDQTTPGTTNKVSIGTDGTVTANAGTNLNTSLLALETGGNLATIAGKDFATQTTLALIKAKTDNIDNATSTLATTANQTNGTQTTRAVSYSSGGYGTFSVSTVDTLSGTSVPCSEVEITNNTAGSTLYVGFDSSTSTSNGLPLGYRDSYRLKITNLNKIYLVGSTTIDVRYVYINY